VKKQAVLEFENRSAQNLIVPTCHCDIIQAHEIESGGIKMRYSIISISLAIILTACAPATPPTPTTAPTPVPTATLDAQAIATAQAQATATAQAAANATSDAGLTRIAQVVNTSKAEGTATSAARGTATAQSVNVTVDALVKSANKVYGPGEGVLELAGNRLYARSGAFLRNFVVEARFTNSHDRAVNPWDYGFTFRAVTTTTCARQYFFYLSSDQTYTMFLANGFRNPDGTCISSATVSGNAGVLNVSQGGSNLVKLVVQDTQAYLFVNGEFRVLLNVSENNNPGDLWIGTGLCFCHRFPGLSTPYKDFTIYALP